GVSQRGSKTENIAQSHGREAPSLGLIREPRIGDRNGVGERVSGKLGEEESSYARIQLHPGCTTRRSESADCKSARKGRESKDPGEERSRPCSARS
ncbi:Transcription factor sdnS, partial [Dissostichus eleginoides]